MSLDRSWESEGSGPPGGSGAPEESGPREGVGHASRRSWQLDGGAVAWMVFVALVYAAATFVRSQSGNFDADHMMILAKDILTQGRFDLTKLTTINDIVTIDDRHYQAMSFLPTVPYFALVPFEPLWPISRFLVSAVVGILAAWTALPLARAYGPGGSTTWWLATLGAFGTMLFPLAVEGDFYYLAHLESVLLISLALIEWKGKRRSFVLGLLIGLAGLARPTLWIVVVPFALAALWDGRHRLDDVGRKALGFGLPILAALAVTGWFDFVRFGNPLETGYAISNVTTPDLAALRKQGLFSISHVSANLGLFLFGWIDHTRSAFPWLVPSVNGQSIFLTTPAILVALYADLRERTNVLLWAAAVLAAIPVFLYYGGGGAWTYGYRYAMDFMPFLLALVAAGAGRQFGWWEKGLIAASVVFCGYGFVWQVFK